MAIPLTKKQIETLTIIQANEFKNIPEFAAVLFPYTDPRWDKTLNGQRGGGLVLSASGLIARLRQARLVKKTKIKLTKSGIEALAGGIMKGDLNAKKRNKRSANRQKICVRLMRQLAKRHNFQVGGQLTGKRKTMDDLIDVLVAHPDMLKLDIAAVELYFAMDYLKETGRI